MNNWKRSRIVRCLAAAAAAVLVAVSSILPATAEVTQPEQETQLSLIRDTYVTWVGSAVGVMPVDFGGEVDTSVLSYTSSDDSVARISGAAGYVKEAATAYLYAKDRTAEITVLKDPGLPFTAWMNVMDFLKYDYNDQVRFEMKRDGDVYTVTKKNNGATGEEVNVPMIIDAAKDTVTFPQLEMFIVGEDAYKAPASVTANPYVLELQPEYAAGSTVSSAVYDLAKYGFDVVGDGDDVYLPDVILSDIFGFNYNTAEYVDGAVYFVHAADEVGADPGSPYVDKTAIYSSLTRDPKEIEFAYNEICFAMDEICGLPPHNLFSESIRSLGFDQAAELDEDLSHLKTGYLMAENRIEYYVGLNYLTAVFGDYGHTSMASGLSTLHSIPVYAETELVKAWSDPERVPAFPDDGEKYNALIMASEMWKSGLYQARAMAYTGNPNVVLETDEISYIETGDKGFFAFDKFKYSVLPDLKKALDHAAENGVKEFYFDISCNGGGDERTAAYLMTLMTGDGTFYYRNAKSGNRVVQRIRADLNQDGVFDEKDAGIRYDFDYKIITSRASFSSGNMLPCLAGRAGIPICGERSGGGTCFVYTLNHADTMACMLSGTNVFVTPDTWTNIEAGAPLTEEWVTFNEDGSTDYSHLYDIITGAR